MRLIAVMDVGKTNVKLVVEDLDGGGEIFVRTRPNLVVNEPPYPHFDTEAIWAFTLGALREAAALHPIDALSITTHGATITLIGATSSRGDGLALPILDYESHAPDELGEAYGRVRPPFSESYTPRLPGGLNIGAQVYWLSRRFPDAFARVTAIVPYPQYWAFRFTGVLADEATSLGVHTDLWAPAKRDFSSFARAEGWDRLFPPMKSAFDRLGPITAEVAAATGLAADTPVICGIHDSNASLLPHLLTSQPPFTVLSTGTWVITFAVGGDLGRLDAGRDGLANVDAYGNPVPSSRFMGGREFALLAGEHAAEPTPADLRAVLERRTMALPTFAPGTGPWPERAGSWTVDPDGLAAGERAAAASLYLALVATGAMEVAGAAGPTIIEGPFGRNALFAEAVERLTGRPLLVAAGSTGTSAGAAMLALGRGGKPVLPAPTRTEGRFDLTGLQPYAAEWRRLVG